MWNARPTADALLDARLADGWLPTATGTVDGDQILGHAACRIPAVRAATDNAR